MKIAQIVSINYLNQKGMLAEELEEKDVSVRYYEFSLDQVSGDDKILETGDVVKIELVKPCGKPYQVSKVFVPRFFPKETVKTHGIHLRI